MPDIAQTVLVLVPHPDDAEFYAGGWVAQLAKEGYRVIIAIATDGRKGSFSLPEPELIATRSQEAYRAAEILGAEPPVMLGHPDQGLDALGPGVLREQFIALIRRFRPRILIAQDPFSAFESHPDHRACAWAATEAVRTAHLPLIHPEHQEQGLSPHLVAEKYFYADAGTPGINKIVDITATIETRVAALVAHASQMEFLVEDIAMQARLAGLDVEGLTAALGGNPAELMGWFIRNGAAETGKTAGFAFGEAYRYERFHPAVEAMLPSA